MLIPMSTIRKVLVTGGAKRVGRAIVERLAAAGFEVAFTYNRSTPADLAWASGIGATPIQADLTDLPRAADDLATSIRNRFDRLDVLVNSASIYEPSSLSQTNLDQIRRLTSIHLEAPLLLAQRFAPFLRSAQGHIVNMVDLLAERPWPQFLAYCTTKAALLNLTLGLARELAPQVTVNGIAPGVVEWPANYPEEEKQKYLQRVPLARAGTPQDVADTVHFLVTGGSYITGQIIHLDGGRSIT
jgi:pteridine reductase